MVKHALRIEPSPVYLGIRMKQSLLFTKTRHEAPKDEVSRSAQLLIRGGYIHKEMAGVYTLLPLGVRVVERISSIVREEMNAAGGVELFLTGLQDREVWEKTDRWSDEVVDVWFKTALKAGGEVGLGFTHEEPITRLMKEHIRSHRDLPILAYQIQHKFRNELRAKSGIMRGREFLMKDLYSFAKSPEEHQVVYDRMKVAYMNVFERLGIGHITFLTAASGGSFAPFSHEFQMLTDSGEDTIYLSRERKLAVNAEIMNDSVLEELSLDRESLEEASALEVGNIFSLGTRFSEPLELTFTDTDGSVRPVIMGSYGIGVTRLMGGIAEVLSTDTALMWPESVAPFRAHVIPLDMEVALTAAREVYERLSGMGVSTLLDDRDMRAGEKFADADLIGAPHRIVVSSRSLGEGGVEYSHRKGDPSIIPPETLYGLIA